MMKFKTKIKFHKMEIDISYGHLSREKIYLIRCRFHNMCMFYAYEFYIERMVSWNHLIRFGSSAYVVQYHLKSIPSSPILFSKIKYAIVIV